MSWICDDCQDELYFEESACSCDEWDRKRLVERIAFLNRQLRRPKFTPGDIQTLQDLYEYVEKTLDPSPTRQQTLDVLHELLG